MLKQFSECIIDIAHISLCKIRTITRCSIKQSNSAVSAVLNPYSHKHSAKVAQNRWTTQQDGIAEVVVRQPASAITLANTANKVCIFVDI